MQLLGVLIVFAALSTACGLKCFSCTASDPKSCTDTTTCGILFDRCFSLKVDGLNFVTKGCQNSVACIGAISCCEGDLCNSAGLPSGPGLLLLLLSSAIIMLF